VKESLGTIPHGATVAMLTKVGHGNDNSRWQCYERPKYQRQQSSWGQVEDMDSALQNGRVENDIQDLRGSPSRKIRLSISGQKKKSQAIR
jgi:hypothetical protein